MPDDNIPIQTTIIPTISKFPVEIFYWGNTSDHYTIEKPHRHNFDEFLFFKKGGGLHGINHSSYQIEDYSIHYVKATDLHFLEEHSASSGFTIAFDKDFLERNEVHSIFIPFLNTEFSSPVTKIEKEAFEELISLSSMLSKQIKENNTYYKEKFFLLGLDMLLNKLGLYYKRDEVKLLSVQRDQKDLLLNSFNNLIGQHALKEHQVAWYANKLNISPKYLTRICKEKRNISPKKLISQYILLHAKSLLHNPEYSIKFIAFEIGFKELGHFGKFFKRETGYSPSIYRKMHS